MGEVEENFSLIHFLIFFFFHFLPVCPIIPVVPTQKGLTAQGGDSPKAEPELK